MTNYKVISRQASGSLLTTVEETKNRLRISGTDDDSRIAKLILNVASTVETDVGYPIYPLTASATYNHDGVGSFFKLANYKVDSIVSSSNTSGSIETAEGGFTYYTVATCGTGSNSTTITYTAGSTPSNVGAISTTVEFLVDTLYENPVVDKSNSTYVLASMDAYDRLIRKSSILLYI